MRNTRMVWWIGLIIALVTACTVGQASEAPATEPPAAATPSWSPTEPAPALLPEESPPPGAEAEFSTDFSRHSVPYDEILSGGPPKDGIPAIDDPSFVTVQEADGWLAAEEPVVVIHVEDVVRAYPIQILMWHEIVNDTVGDLPLAVTYCPLCNTAIGFERRLDGQVLDFGTTGRLRNSNLIMYDRQTESWWQQATGESIAGEFTGRQLTFVPANLVAWGDLSATYPEAEVLSRDTGYRRDYGRNPYVGYDDEDGVPFLFDGQAPNGILPMLARVIGVDLNGDTVGYPYTVLEEQRVVNDTVGGVELVVMWAPGTASALDAGTVEGGRDVGTAAVFRRELNDQTLTFTHDGERIVDDQTGSEWDAMGRATSGPLAGRHLEPVVGVNHFWFSWAVFHSETRVYGVDGPPPGGEVDPVELEADFEIRTYQGNDVLEGETGRFSTVLGQGKPVVLVMYAGLCPTCRSELPEIQAAYEIYGDRVSFLAVDVGPHVGLGSEQDGRGLLQLTGITFPAGAATDAAVLRQYGLLATPTTYFVRPDGEIVEQWTGFLGTSQLGEKIEMLIEAAGR